MNFFTGMAYNLRGLAYGLKTPALLGLGLARFFLTAVLAVVAAYLVLAHHAAILDVLWTRPDSVWLVWLWYALSWLLALLLVGLAAVVAFLLCQVLFAVILMDLMSQITERRVRGRAREPLPLPWLQYGLFLMKQEIPRAVLPVLVSILLMLLGWLTPLAPLLTVVSPLVAAVFLAWDNTDLTPARRLQPFARRLAFLRRHLGFHLGFGLWFLVPGLNILMLAFAPVGAALAYIEHVDRGAGRDSRGSTPTPPDSRR